MTSNKEPILPEEPYYKHYDRLNIEKNNQSPEKSEFTKNEKLIALLSSIAILLVVGGYAANKIVHRNNPVATEVPAAPADTPKVAVETAPATVETPLENTAEVLPTVESLEVSASLISNPEQLVKTFEEERSTAWFNAGATPENAKAALASNDILGYAQKIAAQYDNIYINALFIKNWQSDSSLIEEAKRMKDIHISTLSVYYSTSFPEIDPRNQIPYRRGVEVTAVKPRQPITINGQETIPITTTQHDYDNSKDNMISSEEYGGVTGQDNHPTTSYIVEDGKIRLSHVVFN